jgi:predicted lipoprotein
MMLRMARVPLTRRVLASLGRAAGGCEAGEGGPKFGSFAIAILLTSMAWAGSTRAEVDHEAIARASLTEVIRPGYAAFGEATGALSGKVEALCKAPSDASLKDAKDAFATTIAAWSKVEIFRFGPINEDHRFDRLFYWPDPKSLGLEQVQDVLAKKDQSVTEPDELAKKSVALQGLPALEYLLYGDGAEVLGKGADVVDGREPIPDVDSDRAFRCSFAQNIATNVDRIAKNVIERWREGSDYEKALIGPAPDNPLYHAPKEVTLDLFKTFAAGIELVRDQKIGKPLGAKPEEAKPRLAAFWRSGLTFPNMVGNLEGVRLLFDKGGFAQVVASDSPGVEDSILFDLDHAIAVLSGIDKSMAEVVTDDDLRAKFEALRVGLKSAGQTAGDSIARTAGLSFGFNAMDGD